MTSEQVQRGQQWLTELLQRAGFPTSVRIEQPDPVHPALAEMGNWLTIDESNLAPEQVGLLIGAAGVTLDAMQYLANTTLNLRQPEDQQTNYMLELAGHRARRQAELLKLAESAAAEVRQTGTEVEMQPLSAVERRMIHTILQQAQDLETYSRGQEPHRCLVVRPVQE